MPKEYCNLLYIKKNKKTLIILNRKKNKLGKNPLKIEQKTIKA
jgi:hypothetical protein